MRGYKSTRIRTPPSMFLRTKLLLPGTKGKEIQRPRLLKLLHDNEDKPIVLIIADAGYGKTTLISQWLRSPGHDHVFYSLSEEDSNFELFLSHIIAGFQQQAPDLVQRTKDLVAFNKELRQNTGMVMGTLVNELQEKCRKHCFLILDDFHAIADTSVVHGALRYFIENLPAKIHLVIATRVKPSFPSLIKWRSKQKVFELGREDLIFSAGEVKELISRAYDLNLSTDDLQRIEEYTEGWITGIQLILQSSGLRRLAIKDSLNGFLEASEPLFDYFANEVLSHETPRVREFLAQCSILESLEPRACDAIFHRKDSHALLKNLERRHLFLSALKEDEYKLHHLFRKYLQAQLLESGRHKRLYLRAARYYGKNRYYDLSIKYYLAAKEYSPAGAMMLRSIQEDTAGRISGGIDTTLLRKYLNELPPSALHELPELMVIQGTLTRDAGEHEKALELYRAAERISRASRDRSTCAHSLSETALLHWLQGKHGQALALLKKALRICPVPDKKMRLHIFNLLGLVWQDLSGLAKAKACLGKAKKIAEELDIRYDRIILESNIATIFLQEGDIKRAYQTCKPLIEQLGEHYYYKVGVIFANSARAALDFGDAGWAESCLQQGWNICRRYEDRVSLGTLNHCYGLLHMHRQDWVTAHKHFEEARRVFHTLRWRRMESSVLRNTGTLFRLSGDIPKSLQSVQEAENLLREPVPQKTAHAAFLLADRALLEVEQGRYDRAQITIARCRREARIVYWSLGEMYYALVKTLISLHRNDEKTAENHARSLIRITKKKGYHGILSLELRHKPGLTAFARKIPAFRTYLDQHPIMQGQSTIRVTFFGGLQVEDSFRQRISLEWPTEKTKSLFAFLVINRKGNLTRMQVLDALWSGFSKKKAHENLRTTAYRVRQTLRSANMQGVKQEAIFAHQRGRYILFPDLEIDSDVDDFNRHLKLADIARSPEERKRALNRALDISRAPFLPDIYDQWIDTQRSVHREQRLAALRGIIMIASGQNDERACVEHCRQYLAIEPLAEDVACICMGSLKKLGRLAEIKILYRTLEKKLREEIQSAPTSETQGFYRSLLT